MSHLRAPPQPGYLGRDEPQLEQTTKKGHVKRTKLDATLSLANPRIVPHPRHTAGLGHARLVSGEAPHLGIGMLEEVVHQLIRPGVHQLCARRDAARAC